MLVSDLFQQESSTNKNPLNPKWSLVVLETLKSIVKKQNRETNVFRRKPNGINFQTISSKRQIYQRINNKVLRETNLSCSHHTCRVNCCHRCWTVTSQPWETFMYGDISSGFHSPSSACRRDRWIRWILISLERKHRGKINTWTLWKQRHLFTRKCYLMTRVRKTCVSGWFELKVCTGIVP